MSALGDATDVGLMLAWASRPRETPARHEDYQRVVARYRNDSDFAALVDAVFSGAGLNLIVDERDGAMVTADTSSPLRVTASDIIKRAQAYHRAVIGGVLLAVARTAYPEPSMVDDPDRMAVFTTQAVIDTLDRTARAYADAAQADGDVDDDELEVWRQWLALNTARPNARRRSVTDRSGAVNKVCRFLTEAGYLTARGETDGGTWIARPRFRYAVAALCEDSDLYRLVNDLGADMDDPGAARTLDGGDEPDD